MAAAQSSASMTDHAHLAGEPRAEAGAGNSAADDQDIAMGSGSRLHRHGSAWLRFGKPHRLVVGAMINAGFTELLLGLLAILLVVAAVIDVRTFTISNALNLAVALLAPLYWLSIALPLWPDTAIQLGVGAGVFILFAGAFYAG